MAEPSWKEQAGMLFGKLFAGGAPAPSQTATSTPYDTTLTPVEAQAFPAWKAKYAPNDSGADYDLQGAYRAGLTPDPQTGHWPDTFKKPNHETFSDESQYARGPDAARAGHWNGETFTPPGGDLRSRLANGAPATAPGALLDKLAPGNVTSPGGTITRPDVVTSPGGGFTRPTAPAPTQQTSAVGPGGGLKGAWDQAQRNQLGGLEERKGLERAAGDAGIAKAQGLADFKDAEATRRQRDAEIQQQADEEAHAKLQAFFDKNEQRAEELRNAKTDPGRLLRNADAGTRFTIGMGSALGGMNAMLSGGGQNTSLSALDKIIDADIRSQEGAIDNQKSSLEARRGMYGQLLAETGDRRLAASQTRILMYEGMKSKYEADSARLGIPEITAKTNLMVNTIDGQLEALRTEQTKYAYETFQRQAQAAAAAKIAAEQRAIELEFRVAEFGLKKDHLLLEASKVGTKTGGEGQAYDVHSQYIGKAQEALIGQPGDVSSKVPGIQHLPWQTDARGYKVKLDKYNSEVDTIVGHWAKAEEGKIPVEEFRRLVGRFELDPDMTDEEKADRITGLKQFVDERAKTAQVGRAGQVLPGAPEGSGPGVPTLPRSR